MYRQSLWLCLVTLVVASPPVSRTRDEIEAFKNYLESTRSDDGVVLKNPLASEWENSGKFEGDILLDDFMVEHLVESYASGRNAYIWPNTRWPADTVIWEYADGEFDDAQKEAIQEGMREIEERTCVRFRERQNESAFVRLTGGPGGCYAHVGYWGPRGVHTFNLARNTPGLGCFRDTVIIHEWLHIIGFLHMQSTYNRDEYVEIIWENIQSGTENNFQIYDNTLVSNLGLPYEYISTMHYQAYAFSINGLPTIVALQEHEGEMGQREVVTDMDYLRVNRHYNCPGAWD